MVSIIAPLPARYPCEYPEYKDQVVNQNTKVNLLSGLNMIIIIITIITAHNTTSVTLFTLIHTRCHRLMSNFNTLAKGCVKKWFRNLLKSCL